jgi:hypothetical protein
MSSYSTLGYFVVGERPESWVHTWEDSTGTPIDITGWTVNTTWRINDGTQQERAGVVVSGAAGTAKHVWHAGDLTEAGILAGEMTVTGGSLILARTFQAVILPPRGGTL